MAELLEFLDRLVPAALLDEILMRMAKVNKMKLHEEAAKTFEAQLTNKNAEEVEAVVVDALDIIFSDPGLKCQVLPCFEHIVMHMGHASRWT